MRILKKYGDVRKEKGVYYFSKNDTYFALAFMKADKHSSVTVGNRSLTVRNVEAFPSEVHIEIDSRSHILPKGYKDLLALTDEMVKILAVKGKNVALYRHVPGEMKNIMNPEDNVNGIHVILENEIENFLNFYGSYDEDKGKKAKNYA
jgi:hypothetical protein